MTGAGNCRTRHSRGLNRLLGGVLLPVALAAAAQPVSAEAYVADVWVDDTRTAEVDLTVDRAASSEITRMKAETMMSELGYGGYSFNQVSEQVWAEGRLQYFTSRSYGDGTERRVELNGHDCRIAGLADDSSVEFAANASPATPWCDYVNISRRWWAPYPSSYQLRWTSGSASRGSGAFQHPLATGRCCSCRHRTSSSPITRHSEKTCSAGCWKTRAAILARVSGN